MKIRYIRWSGAAVLLLLWAVLTGALWFGAPKEVSDAERRQLAQFPKFSLQSIWNGQYMKAVEKAAPDQFPMREEFRTLKAFFRYYGLNQADNNSIYLREGMAVKILYPLNEEAVDGNLDKLQSFYDLYLKDTDVKIYASIIPDKNYYLGPKYGYPTMDYETLFRKVEGQLSWAEYVDLTGSLDISDYYATDLHWRQEKLFEAAGTLSQAMGVTQPKAEDYTKTAVEKPFYGVYHGHAALPMEAETMYIMENQLLKDCTVQVVDDNSKVQVYDMEKLESKDLYDIYLSGSRTLVEIKNPNAKTDRELVIFRDSFGSSIAPLLLQDYAKVTLVDLRYVIDSAIVGRYLRLTDQDVLFLYSTEVLNIPDVLK